MLTKPGNDTQHARSKCTILRRARLEWLLHEVSFVSPRFDAKALAAPILLKDPLHAVEGDNRPRLAQHVLVFAECALLHDRCRSFTRASRGRIPSLPHGSARCEG